MITSPATHYSAQNAQRREERTDEHGECESNARYRTHWLHSVPAGFSDIINSFIHCENNPEEQLIDPMGHSHNPTKGSHCDKKKDGSPVIHGNHSFEKCSNMFETQIRESQLLDHVSCHDKETDSQHSKEFIKRQDGNKPHQCDQCDKAFAHKWILARHLGIHTREKPYECAHCEKAFASKWNLAQHLRTHMKTLRKFYHCDQCDKVFMCKTKLNHHLYTHCRLKSSVL